MRADILKSAQSQAELCSVFGNPSRVLILWALGERELSVGGALASWFVARRAARLKPAEALR